jgi:hypothetical protein
MYDHTHGRYNKLTPFRLSLMSCSALGIFRHVHIFTVDLHPTKEHMHHFWEDSVRCIHHRKFFGFTLFWPKKVPFSKYALKQFQVWKISSGYLSTSSYFYSRLASNQGRHASLLRRFSSLHTSQKFFGFTLFWRKKSPIFNICTKTIYSLENK